MRFSTESDALNGYCSSDTILLACGVLLPAAVVKGKFNWWHNLERDADVVFEEYNLALKSNSSARMNVVMKAS